MIDKNRTPGKKPRRPSAAVAKRRAQEAIWNIRWTLAGLNQPAADFVRTPSAAPSPTSLPFLGDVK